MDRLYRLVVSVLLLLISLSQALKFDMQAHTGSESSKYERCIRNFAGRDTLVVVTGIDTQVLLAWYIG